MKKWIVVAAYALVAAGVMRPGAAADRIELVTSSTGFLYVTAYIAHEAGFFAQQDLDVRITDGGGGSNAVASLIGGGAQIAVVGIANAAQAVAKGQTLKAIGTGLRGLPLVLTVRADLVKERGLSTKNSLVERAAILKGRTIAVRDIGGSSGDYIKLLLKAGGVPESSVTVINMTSNAGQIASLKAKRIDAAAQITPIWEMAVREGAGVVLFNAVEDFPEIGQIEYVVQVVREDLLHSQSALLVRYLTAIRMSQLLSQRDPKAAREAFYKYMTKSQKKVASMPEEVRELSWATNSQYIPRSLTIEPKGIAAARAYLRVPSSVSDQALVDNSLALKATAAAH